MTWNCEQIEARLSDYLDGHLSAEELQNFSGHLATCDRCAPMVAQVSGVIARVHALEHVEPPPRLIHNILDQTLGPRKTPAGWRAVLEWLWPKAHPRFALGVATVALAVAVVLTNLDIEWNKLGWADLKPANVYNATDRRAHLLYARGVKFVNDLRVVYEIQTRLEPQQQPEAQPKEQPQQQPQRAPGDRKSVV